MERKDRPEYKILKLRLPLLHLLEMSITNFYNAAYKCDLDIIDRSLSIIFTSCIIFSFVSGRSDSYKSLFTKNLIYTFSVYHARTYTRVYDAPEINCAVTAFLTKCHWNVTCIHTHTPMYLLNASTYTRGALIST